jgi:hypothetical protein
VILRTGDEKDRSLVTIADAIYIHKKDYSKGATMTSTSRLNPQDLPAIRLIAQRALDEMQEDFGEVPPERWFGEVLSLAATAQKRSAAWNRRTEGEK